MENERIENNSSFKKLKKDFEGATAIHRVVKFFELFGIKNKELSEALDSLAETKKQFELLSKAPDKFNSHFAKIGFLTKLQS